MKREVSCMKRILLIFWLLILLYSLSGAKKTARSFVKQHQTKPLITFVEIGSVNCIPCRQMQPIMKAIEEKYAGKVKTVFYDVNKQRAKANEYYIHIMPTQVFLDERGKEFWRHEGFYPQKDIEKLIDEKLAKQNK
jgi:thioredoxin 1